MKSNLKNIIILLCLLVFTGCTDNPTESIFGKYNGTWQWLETSGGFFGRVITPEKGVTVKIFYGKLNTYKLYCNDTLKVQANYNFEGSEKGYDKITYSNIITYNYNFYQTNCYSRVYSDTLLSTDGYTDGYTSYYKKIH